MSDDDTCGHYDLPCGCPDSPSPEQVSAALRICPWCFERELTRMGRTSGQQVCTACGGQAGPDGERLTKLEALILYGAVFEPIHLLPPVPYPYPVDAAHPPADYDG